MAMYPGLAPMQNLGRSINVGMMLALAGNSSKSLTLPEYPRTPTPLPSAAEAVFDNVFEILNGLLLQLINARSPEEFLEVRDRVFTQYFNIAWGLSNVISSAVPKETLEALRGESLAKMEAVFEERGLDAFGADVRDQAIFTAWTLRKISDTCQQIDAVPCTDVNEDADLEIFQDFLIHSMLTKLHLDCMSRSMMLRKSLHPTVLPLIVDGLRNAVNAYALARRALDLRVPLVEEAVDPVEWDEEEDELLKEATESMILEPV